MNRENWSALRAPIGRFDRIIVIDEAQSTQDDARRLGGGEPGLALIAKRQFGGRGRQGRSWDDGEGAALSISMVVRTGLPAAGLSLAVGLAIIEACAALGAQGLGLKWPNDVVEQTDAGRERKLAGVLIEASKTGAVVGVGLNVYQCDDDGAAVPRERAVSLADLGLLVDRPEVAGAVLEHVSAWLEAEPARIREQWRTLGTLRDRRCALRVEGNPIVGVVRDLDAQWRLVLEVRDGSRVRIDAAHAHFEEIDQVRS